MNIDDFNEILMAQLNELLSQFCKKVNFIDKKIVIWGTNNYGREALKYLMDHVSNVEIWGFGDNDQKKYGKVIDGYQICGPDFFAQKPNEYYVVICSFWENQISEQLEKLHIEFTRDLWPLAFKNLLECHYARYNRSELYSIDIGNIFHFFTKAQKLYTDKTIIEKIEKVKTLLYDDYHRMLFQQRIDFLLKGDLSIIRDNFSTTQEYFDEVFYKPNNITSKEVFVDCGAYIGDTVEEFIQSVKGEYSSIIAYEPDKGNYQELEKFVEVENIREISIRNASVGECNESGDFSIVSLDEDIDEPVTWIKMDIEGFELAALRGAKNVIMKFKPKLAICLYHNAVDLYEIPLYLHELVPEYKFKLSQHFRGHYDFILYADVY